MIQLDEKLPPPPAYTNVDGTPLPPDAQPLAMPLPAQSPFAPPPAAQSPQGYPPMSPMSPPANGARPMMQQQPRGPPLTPGQMEAQIGSQYQQQLFARCARGDHDVQKKYGPCGIITAVLLFPIGLICLFADVEKTCARCGTRLP
ncbi:hypothetical protein PsYK624_048610 [Phanerochaete sordida]|uniref:Brain protein I3 n=1 Tax=Phanerochaete sordida TaxID=48140 RepID=A0A9P3G6L8_9APHY|nr:hypothetical protein PsYK624_048610 [Phanerochaete sordida]